jgi:hypothetical protein
MIFAIVLMGMIDGAELKNCLNYDLPDFLISMIERS